MCVVQRKKLPNASLWAEVQTPTLTKCFLFKYSVRNLNMFNASGGIGNQSRGLLLTILAYVPFALRQVSVIFKKRKKKEKENILFSFNG